ncbi:retron St85 family RNA-directed DNA polymerase [Azotobacter armeniacus]
MSTLDTLSKRMLTSKAELFSFVGTAPRRYKVYYIKKRNGKDHRLIAQPAKTIKFIQLLAVEELRKSLLVHHCAAAYEKGSSIKKNASNHQKNQYLLKMDFKNFFLSITPELFFSVARDSGIHFPDEDRVFLSCLFFWKLRRNSPLRLSIGAPSSPFISNFVMSHFDCAVDEFCRKNKITYTRYADDLTFTTNQKGILFEVPQLIKANLKTYCHSKIRINTEKTVYSSKAFNRHITGVTITNDGNLSIGRDKKRKISAMIHRFSLDLLDTEKTLILRGLLAHAQNIEPDFLARMINKYGNEVISRLHKVK